MRAIPLPAGVVPIGATHFFYNPQRSKRSTDVWRKREDRKWFMYMDDKQQWQQIGAKSAHMFVPIESTFEEDRQGREDLNAIYSSPERKPADVPDCPYVFSVLEADKVRSGNWPEKWPDAKRKAEFVPTTERAPHELTGKSWQGHGYGLPVAGDDIEFDRGGKDWIKVTVFAIEQGVNETADVLFRHSEGWGFIDSASERIRPYVDEAEKARRERSAYCDRIFGVLLNHERDSGDKPMNRSDIVEVLYDAGLRFQEEA